MNAISRITPADIQEAKTVDLAALIGTHVRLTKRGRSFWGCCPFHKEKTPSFKVEMGFYKCFGCGKGGDAISWVRESEHLNFEEAIRRLTNSSAPARFCGIRTKPARQSDDDAKRRRRAQMLWNEALPLPGTRADEYLRARGVRVRASAELRCAPAMEHSETGQHFPGLLARLSNDLGFCAVQRTYLAPDKPAKADVKPNKKTLGPMGNSAVRLFPVHERLGIAEGIETALSAAKLYSVPCWATLSANRISRIEIPKSVKFIVIFSDAGEVGTREAFAAQDQYEGQGYQVDVVTPQAHFNDKGASDFNDIVTGHAA